jgi:excisionase family DNA binding protein
VPYLSHAIRFRPPAGHWNDLVIIEALRTPKEAAAYLRVSLKTVRRYVAAGKLTAFSLAGSRTYRLRQVDLERLLVPLSQPQQPALKDFIRSQVRGDA